MQRGKTRPKEEKVIGALVGGYESSDAGDHDEVEDEGIPPPPPPEAGAPPEPPMIDEFPLEPETQGEKEDGPEGGTEEDEKKRLRRQRAEEWKRKRAKEKARESLIGD